LAWPLAFPSSVHSETREQWESAAWPHVDDHHYVDDHHSQPQDREGLRYTISDDWLPIILGWNKSHLPARFDAAYQSPKRPKIGTRSLPKSHSFQKLLQF
jgi:hypothetical protein